MLKLKPILFIQSFICGLVILISVFHFNFGLSPNAFLYSACCATLVLLIWTIFTWGRVTSHFFDLYTIFILGTAAFNSGQVFLEIFGLNSHGMLTGKFNDELLFETVMFIILSLSVIHFGALLRLVKEKNIPRVGDIHPAPKALNIVGMILIGISIVPTFLVMKEMLDVVRAHGYFALYTREDQIGINNTLTLLSNFFVPGLLFALAGSQKNKTFRRWSQFGIIFYGATLILLGRRGDGAEAILSYLIVRHYCIQPIPKKIIFAAAGLMLIVVFPLIAAIRNIDLERRGDLGSMVDAYHSIENPGIKAIEEMGGSMQALSYTIELVPKTRPYDLGASYLYATFSIFPNLFWDIHPSVARGSPSVWLVKTAEPDIAAKGGGLGYSYIAEAYFNFGWWGGPIVLFLFGYALSALVCWSQFSGDPVKIAAAATFFASLVGYVRSDSQSVIRPLFWYSLFPYLMVKWLQSRSKTDERFLK